MQWNGSLLRKQLVMKMYDPWVVSATGRPSLEDCVLSPFMDHLSCVVEHFPYAYIFLKELYCHPSADVFDPSIIGYCLKNRPVFPFGVLEEGGGVPIHGFFGLVHSYQSQRSLSDRENFSKQAPHPYSDFVHYQLQMDQL
ncbi:hypothetical protein [Oryza sativa Japonica Group]|uniref:Uncharacterized protein n=1 Tax=Oryza sativa subsp. japonica TaxID=39947 RepID=Q657Y7_ORYSJ|nr:hypothetical protein [Oryza sativa Japonica Group]